MAQLEKYYALLNGEAFRKATQDEMSNTLSHTLKINPASNNFLWFILIKHPVDATEDRTPSLLILSDNGSKTKCFYNFLSDWIKDVSYQNGTITINYNVSVYSYASIFRIIN